MAQWSCDYSGCANALFESETAFLLHLLCAHGVTAAKALLQRCAKQHSVFRRQNPPVEVAADTDSFAVGLPEDLQLLVRYREQAEQDLTTELRGFAKRLELPRDPAVYVNRRLLHNITHAAPQPRRRPARAARPVKTCLSLECLSQTLETSIAELPSRESSAQKRRGGRRAAAAPVGRAKRVKTMQCLR